MKYWLLSYLAAAVTQQGKFGPTYKFVNGSGRWSSVVKIPPNFDFFDFSHKNPTVGGSEEMLYCFWKSDILVPVLSIRSPLPKEAIGRTTMYMERLVFISFCEGEWKDTFNLCLMTKGQATLLRAKSQLKVNNRTKTSKAPRSKIKTQNFSSYFQSLELLCSDCALIGGWDFKSP